MVGKQFADLGGVPAEVHEALEDPDGGEVRRIGNIVDDERAGKPVCRCGGEGMVNVVNDAETGEYLGSDRWDYPDRRVKESMYPCPSCRPEQFLRWQKKCLEPDHNRKGCPECTAADERAEAALKARKRTT